MLHPYDRDTDPGFQRMLADGDIQELFKQIDRELPLDEWLNLGDQLAEIRMLPEYDNA